MKIEQMTTAEDFITAYPLMKKIPLATDSDRLTLSYCLSGEYSGLKLIKDNLVVGYVFYYIENKICKIIGLWCENNFSLFKDSLFSHAKEIGCKKVRALSNLNGEAYEILTGMRKMYSVYEKEV